MPCTTQPGLLSPAHRQGSLGWQTPPSSMVSSPVGPKRMPGSWGWGMCLLEVWWTHLVCGHCPPELLLLSGGCPHPCATIWVHIHHHLAFTMTSPRLASPISCLNWQMRGSAASAGCLIQTADPQCPQHLSWGVPASQKGLSFSCCWSPTSRNATSGGWCCPHTAHSPRSSRASPILPSSSTQGGLTPKPHL